MQFTYDPLDRYQQDIRLLRINVQRPPTYQIVHQVPLSVAKYVALSYPWGDHEDISRLTIDGHDFNVSTNLVNALDEVTRFWRRTYPNRPEIFLWTDQICINQSNAVEKSHQVNLMGEIYARAHQVLIWLPVPTGVVDGFDNWSVWRDWHRGQILDSNLHNLVQPQAHHYAGRNELAYPLASRQDQRNRDILFAWSHIHGIVCSPWFERGWVYQEFMGSSKATFLWGGLSALWEKMYELLILYASQRDAHVAFCTNELNALKRHGSGSPQESRWSITGRLTQDKDPVIAKEQRAVLRHHGQQIIDSAPSWQRVLYVLNSKVDLGKQIESSGIAHPSLSSLMKHSRNCKLSDPKDRVYAFLGLAHPSHNVKIDYSDAYAVNNVLTDTARAIIESEQRLDILAVARENTSPYDTARDRLPSWVPDWSSPDDPSLPYRHFIREIRLPIVGHNAPGGTIRASGNTKPQVSFLPDQYGNANRVLAVDGILVDEYERVMVDASNKSFRTLRARSGRDVETVRDARPGDEAWVFLGADEVYTLRRGEFAYTILGHALIRDANGVTSDVMHGSLVTRFGPNGVVNLLRRGEVKPTTILVS